MPNTNGKGGTSPTQIRLTDEDKAAIEEIRIHFGLPSMASAIRYAVGTTRRLMLGSGTKSSLKKTAKNPE